MNRANEWKIYKTRILSDTFDCKGSVMNSHHYTTRENSNTCFMTEAINIMDPLILSNTANSRENNKHSYDGMTIKQNLVLIIA